MPTHLRAFRLTPVKKQVEKQGNSKCFGCIFFLERKKMLPKVMSF